MQIGSAFNINMNIEREKEWKAGNFSSPFSLESQQISCYHIPSETRKILPTKNNKFPSYIEKQFKQFSTTFLTNIYSSFTLICFNFTESNDFEKQLSNKKEEKKAIKVKCLLFPNKKAFCKLFN